MMSPATRARRYPALEQYEAAQRRGDRFAWNHPVSQAARHEAIARQFDRWADDARSALTKETWRAVADQEMAKSTSIRATDAAPATAVPPTDGRGERRTGS